MHDKKLTQDINDVGRSYPFSYFYSIALSCKFVDDGKTLEVLSIGTLVMNKVIGPYCIWPDGGHMSVLARVTSSIASASRNS